MKVLRYYDTVFEAEVARGLLESEGILAVVQNENLGSVFPVASVVQSLKPCLTVRDEDVPRAAEVLGLPAPAPDYVKCPECGSEDVAFRYYYKNKLIKPMFRFVMLPLLFVMSAGTGNIRRNYNCRSCGRWF